MKSKCRRLQFKNWISGSYTTDKVLSPAIIMYMLGVPFPVQRNPHQPSTMTKARNSASKDNHSPFALRRSPRHFSRAQRATHRFAEQIACNTDRGLDASFAQEHDESAAVLPPNNQGASSVFDSLCAPSPFCSPYRSSPVPPRASGSSPGLKDIKTASLSPEATYKLIVNRLSFPPSPHIAKGAPGRFNTRNCRILDPYSEGVRRPASETTELKDKRLMFSYFKSLMKKKHQKIARQWNKKGVRKNQ